MATPCVWLLLPHRMPHWPSPTIHLLVMTSTPQLNLVFDGNLNDILGGTLGDAIEQGKVLEPEDRVEIELEINNGDQEGQDKAPDMVIHISLFFWKYMNMAILLLTIDVLVQIL